MPKFVVEWDEWGTYVTHHKTLVDAIDPDAAISIATGGFGEDVDKRTSFDWEEDEVIKVYDGN